MGGLLGAQLCHCPAPAHPTRNSGTNAAGYFELTVLRLTGESRQLRPQFRACRHGSGVASRPSAHAPPLLARTPPPHPCASWPTANIAHTTCLTTALDSTAGADVPGLHQRGRKGRAEPAPVAHPCNAVHPPPGPTPVAGVCGAPIAGLSTNICTRTRTCCSGGACFATTAPIVRCGGVWSPGAVVGVGATTRVAAALPPEPPPCG